MNETLNDFVIGKKTNAGAIGNETFEPQTDGCSNLKGLHRPKTLRVKVKSLRIVLLTKLERRFIDLL